MKQSSPAGGRRAPVTTLLEPALLPRMLRLCPQPQEILRVEYRTEETSLPRRGLLVHLWPHEARRLRSDPLLRSACRHGKRAAAAWQRAAAGAAPGAQRLALSVEDFRILGKLDTAGVAIRERKPPHVAPLAAAPERTVTLSWPPRRLRQLPAAEAWWVPDDSLERFLALIARADSVSWSTLQVHRGCDGFVFQGGLRGTLLPPCAVPLRRLSLAGGGPLYVEAGLEVPALLESLPPPCPALAAFVEGGKVRLRALEVPAREAASLLRPWARRRGFRSGREAPAEATAEGSDLSSGEAAAALARWMRPPAEEFRDRRLCRRLRSAFSHNAPPVGEGDAATGAERKRGWLRHFERLRLPAAVRRRLEASGRRRLGDPRERRKILASQSAALALLLEKLSGPRWREALTLALPLRSGGDRLARDHASSWLNVNVELEAAGDLFSLEALSAKGAHGIVGVGPEIYRQFERLYRRAGERLLKTRDYRRAAHLYSYLLGEHARAAAILEQGGFPREAATVYFHLAGRSRKAAVALERGGLHAEAARVWMDVGVWSRAAQAWQRAGNQTQALAAWRKVVIDLRQGGQLIQAAEILAHELEDRVAALDLLETCALSPGPSRLEALKRALEYCVSLGNDRRARDLLRHAAQVIHRDAEKSSRRRAALKDSIELSIRMASWSRERSLSRLVIPPAVHVAWLAAAATWARTRSETTSALRAELDALLIEAAGRHGELRGDPWLAGDTEVWLRKTASEARSRIPATPVRELQVEGPVTTLHLHGEELLVGDDHGSITRFQRHADGLERLEGVLDSGTSRPLAALEAYRSEVYCAIDEEVHHFEIDGGGGAGRGRTISRPLQIERTLPARVQDLVLTVDGSLMLRVTTHHVHILHPIHLRPAGILLEAGDASIAAVAANHRYLGVLLNRGRQRAEEEALFEVIVFRRKPQVGREEFRAVERFEVVVERPRRLSFASPERDDLLVVADEYLAFLPSRRELARVYELEASSTDGRLPPARLTSLPARDCVLVAYGDGSLEAIHLASKERTLLLDAPGGPLDPLVGFAVDVPPVERAWLLHRSGRLRTIKVGFLGGEGSRRVPCSTEG